MFDGGNYQLLRDPGARRKRFYSVELGCLAGYICCDRPPCKKHCKPCARGYGSYYGQCKDRDGNGVCDKDEMDEDDGGGKLST